MQIRNRWIKNLLKSFDFRPVKPHRSDTSARRKLLSALSSTILLGQFVPALAQSYNLNSGNASIPANNQHPVTIQVGGHRQLISPGQLLTPAEAVALSQVLHSGKQTIVVSQQGTAIGGRFNLTADIGNSLGALNIPNGVTALANFNSFSSINFSGDLSNAGKFYSFSNNPAISTATINAANIYNLPGGLISTVIPNSLLGITGIIHTLNLCMNASGTINNAGTISSGGSLALNAENGIVNTATAALASITAVQNVNLTATNILNSGLISSAASNVNINAAFSSNIAINNSQGTIQALLGDVNVRDASYTGKGNFSLLGGDVLSKNLNIFSGCGAANVDAQNITGVTNIAAGEAHVLAATPNLQLGAMNILGDPTYFNTNGDVTLSNDIISSGASVAIVARGNISSSKAITIDTDGKPLAGNITIIAGARMIPNPIPDATSGGNENDSGTLLSITGASATGGSVDFSSAPVTLKSAATDSLSQPGNVTILGLAGADTGSGQVNLGKSSIITTGGGNVLIISSAVNGSGIKAGLIDAFGTLKGGSIVLRTSSVDLTGVQIQDGNLTGSISAGATQNSSITLGDMTVASFIQTNQSPVLIVAGQDVSIGSSIYTLAGSLGIFAGGNIVSIANGIDISTSSNSTDTKNIVLAAGVNTSATGDNNFVQMEGPSSTGGSLLLNQPGAAISTLTTGTLGAQNAGSINLIAAVGTAINSGRIDLPSAVNINTSTATPSSFPGSVSLMAGSNASNAISIGGINSSVATSSGSQSQISILNSQLAKQSIVFDGALATQPTSSANSKGSVLISGSINTVGEHVTIFAGGNLQTGSIILTNSSSNLTSTDIKAGGTITLNGNVTNTNASSTFVPTVTITGDSVLAGPATNATITASGSTAGGVVAVSSNNNLTLGTSNAEMQVNASPASGSVYGKITVSSGKDLLINDASAINFVPNISGGSINLTAGANGQGNLKIVGTLKANPDSNVTLKATTSNPVNLGDGTASSGIASIDTTGKGSGSTISVVNSGTGGILISNSSSISVSSGSTVTLNATKNISVAANNPSASLSAPAGVINLTANSFVLAKNLLLNVDGDKTNAGSINIQSTGSGATANRAGLVSVGSASTDFSISANGNASLGGDAGSVSITSGSNITVNTAALQIKAGPLNGAGGSLSLNAGIAAKQTGTVIVNGPIDLTASSSSPGNSGHLSIKTNSAQILTISDGSKAPLNGVNGGIDISGLGGGAVALSNLGAGVSVVGSITSTSSSNAGAIISISATKGDITLNNLAGLNSSSTSGAGGAIILAAAAGKITYTTLNASSSSGNGGSISMTSANAKAVAINGSTVNVSGANAGSLSVINTGAGGVLLTPANTTFQNTTDAGKLNLEARGGGNVVVSASLNMNSATGKGGSVNLNAAKGSVVAAGIDVSGAVTSTGGSIQLSSNSSKAFTVDSSLLVSPANGVKGLLNASGGSGGTIIISNLGGGVSAIATALNVTGANTDSGKLTLLANKGDLFVSGPLDLTNTGLAGSITLLSNSTKPLFVGDSTNISTNTNSVGTVTADGKTGGNITITNVGPGGVSLSATLSATGTANAGSIIVDASAKGKLSFLAPSTPVRLDASTSAGAGGSIRLIAGSYVFNNINSNIQLKTNGSTSGGNISVYSYLANQGLKVGSSGILNSFNIEASAINGAGGVVAISSGGDLSVDVSGLSTNATGNGNGASLTFIAGSAGAGNLNVVGTLIANGQGTGNGGSIALLSNSTQPFFVDGSTGKLNGIAGSLNAGGAAGGNIGIRNNGTGGLTIDASQMSALASSKQGGSYDFEAPFGSITVTGSGFLNASSASGSNQRGGGIIFNAAKIIPSGVNLTLMADSDGSARAGAVRITQTDSKTPLVLGSQNGQINVLSNHSSFIPPVSAVFNSANNIQVSSNFGDGRGDITLQTTQTGTGTINTLNGAVLSAQNLTISSGKGDIGATQSTTATAATPFSTIGANNLQTTVSGTLKVFSNGGNVFIQNRNVNLSLASITQMSNGKAQNITLSSNQDITVQDLIGRGNARIDLSAQNLSFSGNLLFKGFVSAPQINIQSAGKISQNAGNYIGMKNASLLVSAGTGDTNLVSTDASKIRVIGNGADLTLNNLGTISNLVIAKNTQFKNVTISADGSIALVRDDNTSLVQVSKTLTLKTNSGSNGSIIISTPLNATDMVLDADGYGSLIATVGLLQINLSNSVTLKSDLGNIGYIQSPFLIQAPIVTLSSGGAGSINVSDFYGTGVTLNSSRAGGALQFAAPGPLTIAGDITATHGFVDISINTTVTTGDLKVNDNVTIFAGGGPRSTSLSLENVSPNSNIEIGKGVQLISNGNMSISFGFDTSGPGVPLSDSNFNIVTSGTNNVYLNGAGTFSAPGALKNAAFALGGDVLFYTGKSGQFSTPGTITVDGGASFTARAPKFQLQTLDLTDKAAGDGIRNFAAIGNLGIKVANLSPATGAITSGDIFIDNTVDLAMLSGLNIPAKVTVHFTGFDASTPVAVQRVNDGNPFVTPKNINIAGKLVFEQSNSKFVSNVPSSPEFSVISSLVGPTITMTAGSAITSDGNLTIYSGGDASIAGTISAPGSLSFFASAGNNFKANAATPGTLSGAISLSGTISTGATSGLGQLAISTTAGFFQTAGLLQSNAIALTVSGSNIIQQKAGVINATTMKVSAGDLGASFSFAKNAFNVATVAYSDLKTVGSTLSINTTNSMSISGITDTARIVGPNISVGTDGFYCVYCTFETQHLTLGTSTGNAFVEYGTITVKNQTASSSLIIDGDSGSILGQQQVTISMSNPSGTLSNSTFSLFSPRGNVLVDSKGSTNLSNFIEGGGPPTSPGPVYAPWHLPSQNTITINSGKDLKLSVVSPSFLDTPGNISIKAANISTGNKTTIISYGGNISLLASGSITSGSTNNLEAHAQGTTASNISGGVLELGAGLTSSSILTSLNLAPGTRPVDLSGATVNGVVGSGAIQYALTAPGIINFTNTVMTLQGGEILVTSKGANKNVSMQGATLKTFSYRPISETQYQEQAEPDELIVDADEGLE